MQSKLLNEILQETKDLTLRGQELKVVFDLDSTLYDVAPRIYEVFREFVHAMEERYPEDTAKLKGFQLLPKEYGLKAVMMRLGLAESPKEFQELLRGHWIEKFFNSSYLHHDEPYEGAVEFVKELYQAGARIIYLTGRDVERMGEGTFRVLLETGFPAGIERTELILKPEKGMHDPTFKCGVLRRMTGPLWFIENEPENIVMIRSELPNLRMIFFDSVHTGRAAAPTDLPTITSYKR